MEEKRTSHRKPLYFPTNCPDANDFVAGFGMKELVISIVAFCVALIVGIIVYMTTGGMIRTLAVGFTILGGTIVSVKRNRQQECLVDWVVQVFKYWGAQKKYEYRYYNIYEGREQK